MPSNAQEAAGRAASRGSGGQVARADADILRRGLDTFAELGYQATTVRELAKRLDVSHNYVNDRYGSKEGFWRAVIDFAVQDLRADFFAPVEGTDDAEMLRTVILRFFTATASSPQLNRIVADESTHDSGRLDYLAAKYTRGFWEQLTPVIRRLMDGGRMPQVPEHLVFVAINGAALALTHQHMYDRLGPAAPDTADDAKRRAETLTELIVGGLLPSHRQGSR
ncbi:TetR/AcrR family transcriptional regulator [Streptomyces sp. NPDC026673]|uniref:TetR/AcrR family transcriptional regulator n=1 Tax=Streptomyces sp. NPDC026673 TaxID=3155724 RepID=UPI0033C11A85